MYNFFIKDLIQLRLYMQIYGIISFIYINDLIISNPITVRECLSTKHMLRMNKDKHRMSTIAAFGRYRVLQ